MCCKEHLCGFRHYPLSKQRRVPPTALPPVGSPRCQTASKQQDMSTSADLPDLPEYTEEDAREDVLDELKEAMDEALHKFTEGRVYNAENEKVRIQWLRAYTHAVGEYRRLVADLEEAEHEERIVRLETLVEELSDG